LNYFAFDDILFKVRFFGEEKMDNIVLIGMPGVGKSTLGVILAKLIGYRFVDTDLIIQEKCGSLLREIIEKDGVQGFIDTENRICASINANHSVIATGGSVVYGKEAMEHLRSIGTVVYLKQDIETIRKRVGDMNGRGVVLRHGQSLEDIFDERAPLYEEYAHVTVELTLGTVEDNLSAVLEKLKKR
jgi:shikimate kinase